MDNDYDESEYEEQSTDENHTHSRLKKTLLLSGIIFLVLLLVCVWIIFTKSGRRVIYRIAGGMIYQRLDKDDELEASSVIIPLDIEPNIDEKDKIDDLENIDPSIGNDMIAPKVRPEPRKEDYVSNYLLFGLEEIFNAKNADTIMIASINTMDSSIKLTSILRDTYIDVDGYNPNKINAFFALGGAKALSNVIEDKYRIKMDGYAYINFESFEKIIDYLGGISIELGAGEAEYLNTTNYISNPQYRNLVPGWNLLNGNQTLGYCRIRLVETLGGANDDYGRTLRQRRVLRAIFDKYKSRGILELLRISNNILQYVKTNVTQRQIEKALEDIIENKVAKMDTMRLPVNGAYEEPLKYNGITYPLVYDWDANVIELFQFIYLDTKEEAQDNIEKYR